MKTEDHRKVLEMDMTQLYALRARNHGQLFSARADVTQWAHSVAGTADAMFGLFTDRVHKLKEAVVRLEVLSNDQLIVNTQLTRLRVIAEQVA
jgi:hypothetical protein